jgi:hypothetical protein
MDRRIDLHDADAVPKLVRRAHRLRARYMSRVFRHVFRRIGHAFGAALEFRRELLFTNKRPVHW